MQECGDCREEKEERCTVHLETKYLPVKVKKTNIYYNVSTHKIVIFKLSI